MLGGIFTVRHRNVLGVKAIAIAAFLRFRYSRYGHFPADHSRLARAFLMQFMVQGARVVPTAERAVRRMRAGKNKLWFVYQSFGNLLASVNATLQARIAETHSGNYGWQWRSWLRRGGYFNLCILRYLVARPREPSSPAYDSDALPSAIGHRIVNTTPPAHTVAGALPSSCVVFTPFNEQQRLHDGICLS